MKPLSICALIALTLLCGLTAAAQGVWTGGNYEIDEVLEDELLPVGDTEIRFRIISYGSYNCCVQAGTNDSRGSATIKVRFRRLYTYAGSNPPATLSVTASGSLQGYISSSSATAATTLFKETGGSFSDSAAWPNYSSYNYSVAWGAYTPPNIPPTIICYAKATGAQAGAKTTGYLTN